MKSSSESSNSGLRLPNCFSSSSFFAFPLQHLQSACKYLQKKSPAAIGIRVMLNLDQIRETWHLNESSYPWTQYISPFTFLEYSAYKHSTYFVIQTEKVLVLLQTALLLLMLNSSCHCQHIEMQLTFVGWFCLLPPC